MWQCLRGQSEDASLPSAFGPVARRETLLHANRSNLLFSSWKANDILYYTDKEKVFLCQSLVLFKPSTPSHYHHWRFRLLSSLGCRGETPCFRLVWPCLVAVLLSVCLVVTRLRLSLCSLCGTPAAKWRLKPRRRHSCSCLCFRCENVVEAQRPLISRRWLAELEPNLRNAKAKKLVPKSSKCVIKAKLPLSLLLFFIFYF